MRNTLTREPRPLRPHLNTFANPQTTRPETDGKKPMDGKRPDELKRSQLLRNQREVNGSKAVIGIYNKKKRKNVTPACLRFFFHSPLTPCIRNRAAASAVSVASWDFPSPPSSFSPHLKVRGGGRGGGGCPHHCQQQYQSAGVSLPFALAASAQRQ